MKTRAARISIILLWAVPVGIVTTAMDMWLWRAGHISQDPTFVSLLAMCLVAGVVAVHALWIDTGQQIFRTLVDKMAIPVTFAVLSALYLLGSLLPGANWKVSDGLHSFLLLYDLIILLLAMISVASFSITENIRIIFIIYLLVYLLSVLVDVIYPYTFSNSWKRSAGFSEDPNQAALVITLIAVMAVSWNRLNFVDIMIWLLAAAGILSTLSRGGMIIFCLVFAINAINQLREKVSSIKLRSYFRKGLSVAIFAVGGAVLVTISTGESADGGDRFERLLELFSFDTRSLLSDPRVDLLSKYVKIIQDSLIFGHGVGYFYKFSAGPHNIYISLWIEIGLIGLLAYGIFLATSFIYFYNRRDTRGLALMGMISVAGMFSHTLLFERPLFVVLGIAIVTAEKKLPASVLLSNKLSPNSWR